MPDLAPGDTYGDYRVLEHLGRGSFASVYKVGAPFLERPMALKLSHEAVGSDEQAQRSLREISILRTLTNPHVVRLHDAGLTDDGRVFLLMDCLTGRPLNLAHDIDMPLPPAHAVATIHQACLGLAEAHAHGIVHRDVKPENLWITPDGRVIVLDFGLARSWNHDTPAGAPATVGHMMVGTPHYIQPEQVQGSKLTPASDVYSLATLLYELLTGRTPFFVDMNVTQAREHLADDAIGWLKTHCLKPIVPLAEVPGGDALPASLDDLLRRCLSKAPEERPADAGVLANELGEILHHDLAVVSAAMLRVTHPYGGSEERRVLPGSHRVGSDASCEIRLAGEAVPSVAAVVEWTGAPRLPVVRPSMPLTLNGDPLMRPRELRPGDTLEVAGFRLELLTVPGARLV